MVNYSEYAKKIKEVRKNISAHIRLMEEKYHSLHEEPFTSVEWADARRDNAISVELGQKYIDLLQEVSDGLDAGEITL